MDQTALRNCLIMMLHLQNNVVKDVCLGTLYAFILLQISSQGKLRHYVVLCLRIPEVFRFCFSLSLNVTLLLLVKDWRHVVTSSRLTSITYLDFTFCYHNIKWHIFSVRAILEVSFPFHFYMNSNIYRKKKKGYPQYKVDLMS